MTAVLTWDRVQATAVRRVEAAALRARQRKMEMENESWSIDNKNRKKEQKKRRNDILNETFAVKSERCGWITVISGFRDTCYILSSFELLVQSEGFTLLWWCQWLFWRWSSSTMLPVSWESVQPSTSRSQGRWLPKSFFVGERSAVSWVDGRLLWVSEEGRNCRCLQSCRDQKNPV